MRDAQGRPVRTAPPRPLRTVLTSTLKIKWDLRWMFVRVLCCLWRLAIQSSVFEPNDQPVAATCTTVL